MSARSNHGAVAGAFQPGAATPTYVSTGITGLGNHTSVLGDSLDLGSVHAGDVLTFVLNNSTLGATAYSDPTMNVA